jgi:hypothetical protein
VHEPGGDGFLLARGAGDRAGGGVVAAGFPVGVAARIVAGLCDHPGAEDSSHARLGPVDLSVRVPAKILLRLSLQDLDLRAGQLRRAGRLGCLAEQFQGVGGVQVLEGLQRGGKVLPQLVPQPVHLPGPLPDQRLVGARQDLDALGFRAVPGRRAQLVGISPHHVGQRVRVACVALGPRHPVPVPEPGRLQRVHREHQVAGRHQRRHPRAAVGLDPDDHMRLVRLFAQEPPDQPVELRDPRRHRVCRVGSSGT